jgi:general stress protein 26
LAKFEQGVPPDRERGDRASLAREPDAEGQLKATHMMDTHPRAELHIPFSDPKATATPWARARGVLEKAGVFWLSTIRPDGRPHVTPLVAVWVDGSLYFCTGPDEVKAKNLARNARCILTTGCNAFRKGLDVVVEGEVGVVTDEPLLRRLVAIWKRKYDDFWHFEVRDGAFHHEAGKALVFGWRRPRHLRTVAAGCTARRGTASRRTDRLELDVLLGRAPLVASGGHKRAGRASWRLLDDGIGNPEF